ncbi:diaminopimelate decarboxylase [Halalkalicoccus jeotgali]|uniref:Diaminopimelate decarboxylase n=1 Tax=Halalkalicoccus jeotgali (strain DSM 18796 / CECT 7217 / JCM 14584 / KCTC 4019 / B3) TaxID=795797 RepID=D8J896_HALJB|nr:diaminopimelate decarboxylase [Halalkalicoccus jeotgali]ADJ16142.1 diaminopimelate decarboxylase [Halalkalicoccus jeotgali B3]ELY37571.1 diaminopimelate decarboxylase [Halalkalicoccus jeotgali B3]
MNPPVRRLADWDAARLAGLADTHGTPLYVQDLDRVRENYARMAAAFPEGRVMYAAKANTAKTVLGTLSDAGAGIECASAGEVERALAAGCLPERVQYTAVNPPEADLDYAVSIADDHPELTITAGAEDTIDRLAERGFSGRLCLRVNPGVGAGHHEKVSTGANAKFGVPIERAPDLLDKADERFDVVGIHAHAGSGISGEDLAAHRELVSRMGELARRTDLDLEFVDVGGGFGVPYREGEEPLDLQAVARATREALGEVEATLAVEPGRYLVADAGVLLTRVNTVKPAGEELVVGVDAGMTTLARPAIYGAHHGIRSLAEGERETVEATVTGPICESGDVFGEYDLPAPERGDLLAVGNAGAYGYEMASQYNSRPRPATVVVDGENSGVDRRRETLADVTRLEREVTWS